MKTSNELMKALMAAVATTAVMTVGAVDMPDPVEGVVTLNVTSTTTYDGGIPSGTTKLVKAGVGEAILSVATDDFAGTVEVQGGTLTLTDYDALGSKRDAAVTVSDGATLAFKGRNTTSETERLHNGTITIAGSGVNSAGAVYYAPTSGTQKYADYAFNCMVLSADAAVGNTVRFGWWEGTLNLNGHTLTLLNGQFMFRDTVFHPGCIDFNNGNTSYFWGNNDFTTHGCTEENLQFTVRTKATANMYRSTSEIPAYWYAYGAITGGALEGAQYNRLTGTIKLMQQTTLSSDGGSLNINGKVDLNGYTLTRYQAKPTYFAGELDGRASGSTVCPYRSDFIFTGNVERVICGATKACYQGLQYGASLIEVNGGKYYSRELLCGYQGGQRGIFSLKDGYAGFGSVYIGFNGNNTIRPNGVLRIDGGVFNCTNCTLCGSNSTEERRSQAFYLQSGGRFALTNAAVAGTFYAGEWGDSIVRVAGGTNSTICSSGSTRSNRFIAGDGKGTCCVSVEGAGSRIETESAVFLKTTISDYSYCTLSLKDGGEFCAKRFMRSNSDSADSTTAVFNLISDGGVLKPLLSNAWNDMPYETKKEACESRRPNNTVLLDKGLVVDISECAGFSTQFGDSEISMRLKKPTGKSLKSITLPAAVTSATYFEPAMIVVEGAGFGAAAYCDVDRTTKQLTAPVITCAGSGYDTDTTHVYVYAPDSLERYECMFELAEAKCGPLTVRGNDDHALYLPMPDNTCDGGINVEQGTLKLGTNAFVEATAVALGDTKGHRGRVWFDDAAEHTISKLSGFGKVESNGTAPITVRDSYSVDASQLTSDGGVVAVGTLAFADGSKILVDTEGAEPLKRIAIVSANTLTGNPTVEISGPKAVQWVTYRVGQQILLSYQHGFVFTIR